MEENAQEAQFNVETAVQEVLASVDREREREIISRRFGLFDRRETLEQIGELLGITRERVRQLEKAILTKLKAAAQGDLAVIKDVEKVLTQNLQANGKVARVSEVGNQLTKSNSKVDQSRLSFLGQLSPGITVVEDNDNYFHALALAAEHSEKAIAQQVAKIIDAITKIGEPTDIETVAKQIDSKDTKNVEALASISKDLANLHGRWGLTKWPMVNPKNIRDKIYVILHDAKKPMHFSEISKSIKDSDFKRKDVTTQAIHNELIKDKRFVLIGRGIYALREWGYKKGTVADVIAEVLRKEGGPLHRDEIVRRVLKSRQVKETTILLNLQGKPQFKRVAKATYTLAE